MRLKMENKLLTAFSFSSLTDVVMLLLIFFLLSSSFVVQPGIKVQLPRSETGESGAERKLTITVTDNGRLFLNSEKVTLQSLGEKLSAALAKDRDRIVVVKADKKVTLQKTVDVIDVAKGVGAQRFLIATRPLTAQEGMRP